MKIRITKDQLNRSLGVTTSAIKGSQLPILGTILFNAEGQGLCVTGTNLDLFLRVETPCSVDKPGAVCIPAGRLKQIAREMTAEEITIEADEKNRVVVAGNGSRFVLNGTGHEEFPPCPKVAPADGEHGITTSLSQNRVREALHCTTFAISTDASRFVLNGVFFEFGGKKLNIVATDGRRLSIVSQESPLESKHNLIIPTFGVKALESVLREEGDMDFSFDDRHARFVVGDVTIISKLIDGNYPNYNQVIPEINGGGVSLERAGLLGALRRVSIMTDEKSESVKLHFKDTALTLSARSDLGESTEGLLCPKRKKDLAIAFNHEYLIEPLSRVEVDNLEFHCADELSPGVFISAEKNWRYVVMPMRLT